jgi:hypothetical protein
MDEIPPTGRAPNACLWADIRHGAYIKRGGVFHNFIARQLSGVGKEFGGIN